MPVPDPRAPDPYNRGMRTPQEQDGPAGRGPASAGAGEPTSPGGSGPAPVAEDADPAGPARPDPAASMSLITQLLRNPLDAGYHAYAEDSHRARLAPWRRVVIALVAVALGAGSTVAVRSLRAPVDDTVRATLLQQTEARQSTVGQLDRDVQGLSAQIRATAGTAPQSGSALDDAMALATARTAVEGPGLEVTLDDAPGNALDKSGTRGVVRDQDLRMVLNALWSGGADAVSVNGMRIGPGTFVRTAGSTILVNVTPVQAPYTVTAIGDADQLQVALVRGSTGDYLSTARSARGISVASRSSQKLEMAALDERTTVHALPVDQNSSGG